MDAQTMTDAEIIQRAKQTFVLDTPTERLARELIGVAERYADTEADSASPYSYAVAEKAKTQK